MVRADSGQGMGWWDDGKRRCEEFQGEKEVSNGHEWCKKRQGAAFITAAEKRNREVAKRSAELPEQGPTWHFNEKELKQQPHKQRFEPYGESNQIRQWRQEYVYLNTDNYVYMVHKFGPESEKNSSIISSLSSLRSKRKKVFNDDIWDEFDKIWDRDGFQSLITPSCIQPPYKKKWYNLISQH